MLVTSVSLWTTSPICQIYCRHVDDIVDVRATSTTSPQHVDYMQPTYTSQTSCIGWVMLYVMITCGRSNNIDDMNEISNQNAACMQLQKKLVKSRVNTNLF